VNVDKGRDADVVVGADGVNGMMMMIDDMMLV